MQQKKIMQQNKMLYIFGMNKQKITKIYTFKWGDLVDMPT